MIHEPKQPLSDENLKALSYEKALRYIVQVLGSGGGDCSGNKCQRCKFEMNEALEAAQAALTQLSSKMLERLQKLEVIALVGKLTMENWPTEHNLEELRRLLEDYWEVTL